MGLVDIMAACGTRTTDELQNACIKHGVFFTDAWSKPALVAALASKLHTTHDEEAALSIAETPSTYL